MPITGRKPKEEGEKRNRVKPVHDWVEILDVPFDGLVPVKLPARRVLSSPEGPYEVAVHPLTRQWWKTLCTMPHVVLWAGSDWMFALQTALVADDLHHGRTAAATELRQREKILGTTADSRRDLRIRYVPEVDGPAEETPVAGGLPAGVASLDARRARLTGTD